MSEILSPLEAPYPASISETLKKYPDIDGYILALFRVFANSERFLSYSGPKNLLDKSSPLSLREREIIILRCCAQLDCEYEWGVHVVGFAAKAELNENQINSLYLGSGLDDCWPEKETELISLVDQLIHKARINYEENPSFSQYWNKDEQLEIFALVANYHLVAFVANSSKLELEPFATRFPKP